MNQIKSGLSLKEMTKFFFPIFIENVITISITFLFSSIVGTISVSSLTAITFVNTIINFLAAALSMLTMGSSIMASRFVGAGDKEKTTTLVEQSLLLTIVITFSITAIMLVFSDRICHLLLHNVERSMFEETKLYLILMAVSFPFLMFYNVDCLILRAVGNSKEPMMISTVMNVSQVILAFLLVSGKGMPSMGVLGAGIATLSSRVLSGGLATLGIFREKEFFSIRFLRIFKPERNLLRRFFNIGIPTSLEQLCVQGGYLLANTLAVSLGTHDAAVYTVVNTLYSVPIIFHTIFYYMTTPCIGHHIGAGDVPGAKRTGYGFWAVGTVLLTLLAVTVIGLKDVLVPLLSAEASVIADSKAILWVILLPAISGMPLNVIDPALRVGGDVKFVMIVTAIAVWVVRLPLTYLFCFVWNMGAIGVFYANAANLVFRAVCNVVRFAGKKWVKRGI